MKHLSRFAMAGLALTLGACAEAPEDPPQAPAIDPFVAGRSRALSEMIEMDLGERGGFPSVVNASVHYPENGRSGAGLVVFAHSYAVRPAEYAVMANQLATWGMVVVVPTFDSGTGQVRDGVGLADDMVAAVQWLKSNSLPLSFEPNVTSIGLAGHGRGATQAIAAGRRLGEGAVAALAPISGPPPGAPSGLYVAEETFGGLAIPTMIVNTTAPPLGDELCGVYSPDITVDEDAWVVDLPDAVFTDLIDSCSYGTPGNYCSVCPSSEDSDPQHTLGRGYLSGFLLAEIGENPGAKTWLSQERDGGSVSEDSDPPDTASAED